MKLVLLFTLFSLCGMAAENPVAWSFANPPKKALKPGETVTLHLEAAIEPGWHLYSLDVPEGGPIPTEIGLAEDSHFDLGSVKESKPSEIFDPNFNMRVRFHTEKASFQLPVKVQDDAAAGSETLVVQTRYQSCNDSVCLPPKKVKVSLPVVIRAR